MTYHCQSPDELMTNINCNTVTDVKCVPSNIHLFIHDMYITYINTHLFVNTLRSCVAVVGIPT